MYPSTVSKALLAAIDVGKSRGLDHFGTTPLAPWVSSRSAIEMRKAKGYGSSMSFTYKNPARSTNGTRIFRGARSALVVAMPYGENASDSSVVPSSVRGKVAQYARTDQAARLGESLKKMTVPFEDVNIRTQVVSDDNSLVDREAAWRAGIGFYGKNSMLLVRGRGSKFLLGSIVVSEELTRLHDPVASTCGTCERCIDDCPTGAIDNAGGVDASRCISWILQTEGVIEQPMRRLIGNRLYGCDDCQTACPIGATAASNRDSGSDIGPLIASVLAMTPADILTRFAHWYIPNRNAHVVLRNALIVAENSGDSEDQDLIEAVATFRSHRDEMLAQHAQWAHHALLSGHVTTSENSP